MRKRSLYLMAVIALALALVNAAVFVYNPINVGLTPEKPPVYFYYGSNANQQDLWGNSISVSLSDANTSLNIQVHPTYQVSYYKNITVIKNQDPSNTYYIKFDVTDTIEDSNVTSAYLIVTDSGGSPLTKINLKTSGLQPSGWITISSGATLTVSLNITIIPDPGVTSGTDPHLADGTAKVNLIVSPQNSENP